MAIVRRGSTNGTLTNGSGRLTYNYSGEPMITLTNGGRTSDNFSRNSSYVEPVYDNNTTARYTAPVSNNQTFSPFSTADTLNQRAQAYKAQGLDGLANSYSTLNTENNIWNNTANKITKYYSDLAKDIASREEGLANVKTGLANQLMGDIANQRDYVNQYFGPNGIFTNEVNKFYDENGNYLASEAGRQMAMANAEGIQSGASLGAQRAARNAAYNEAFQNYIKVKEQELTAKMNIQNQLMEYMSALRQEYGNTANAYIIAQYERANDLLNAISKDLAATNANIESAKMSYMTTPKKTTSADGTTSEGASPEEVAANNRIFATYKNFLTSWDNALKGKGDGKFNYNNVDNVYLQKEDGDDNYHLYITFKSDDGGPNIGYKTGNISPTDVALAGGQQKVEESLQSNFKKIQMDIKEHGKGSDESSRKNVQGINDSVDNPKKESTGTGDTK